MTTQPGDSDLTFLGCLLNFGVVQSPPPQVILNCGQGWEPLPARETCVARAWGPLGYRQSYYTQQGRQVTRNLDGERSCRMSALSLQHGLRWNERFLERFGWEASLFDPQRATSLQHRWRWRGIQGVLAVKSLCFRLRSLPGLHNISKEPCGPLALGPRFGSKDMLRTTS